MILFWLCMAAAQGMEVCLLMDLWGDDYLAKDYLDRPEWRLWMRIVGCMLIIPIELLLFRTAMMEKPFSYTMMPLILLLLYARKCRQKS